MNPIVVLGWLLLAIGSVTLGYVIVRPPVVQSPRVLISRTMMPISEMLFGVCMVIQPITIETVVLPLVAAILSTVALYLELRYRPQRV